ncbi:hypothetical protein D3C80_883810 [compost metagenome]
MVQAPVGEGFYQIVEGLVAPRRLYLPGHQIRHPQLLERLPPPGLAALPVDHQIMQGDDARQSALFVRHRQRLDLMVREQIPGRHG